MDNYTLITSAISLISPFLTKTGEGVARKIGEDIWNLIKSPFNKKGVELNEIETLNDTENFKSELLKLLEDNPEFKSKLTEEIIKSENLLSGNFNQVVNNNNSIEKQVNIQNNTGDINL
ncbi:hypothetical protein V8245_05190 [Flavobacterium columnare]|uniref:hypothetical protein n=1 Tax=Flavobacterium columnare TaxID=996 RepID=UPI003C2DED98